MAANSVLAGVLVARLLGAGNLGILVVVNITVATAVQISSLGLPTANTYFTARDRETLVPATVNGAIFAVFGGFLCAFAVWLCSPLFLLGVPLEIVTLGLLSVPFQLLSLVIFNLFLAQGEVKRFNYLDFLNQSFVLINAVLVLVVFGGGLLMLVTFNLATAAGMSFLSVVIFYRYLAIGFDGINWRGDLGLFVRMLRYALKGHVHWVAITVIMRSDVIIVNHFAGTIEAAVYGVATQYTLFLMLLPNVVANLMLQRVASSPDEASKFSCAAARHISCALFAACLLSIPLVQLLPVVYGSAFAGAPFLAWLLLPGVFFYGVQMALTQYFVGTGLPKLIPAVWVATLILNLVLNFLVVPKFGATGAALVSTFCYAFAFIIIIIAFRKWTGHHLSEILICNREDFRRFRAFIKFGVA